MHNVKDWVQRRFRGAVVEQRSFRGQVRYSVPIWRGESEDDITPTAASQPGDTSVNRIFKALEEAEDALELEYYSVSQTTLGICSFPLPPPFRAHTNCGIDQVFLTIARSADVAEEGYEVKKKKWFKFWKPS